MNRLVKCKFAKFDMIFVYFSSNWFFLETLFQREVIKGSKFKNKTFNHISTRLTTFNHISTRFARNCSGSEATTISCDTVELSGLMKWISVGSEKGKVCESKLIKCPHQRLDELWLVTFSSSNVIYINSLYYFFIK